MNLIRRLAMLGNIAVDTQVDAAHSAHGGSRHSSGSGSLQPMANLIVAHREALRQAATGSLDHMVIDVVGSLFDQILSDPKVPPQMARQIARLQLPVLRAALGDPTFFSSRRHPVRTLRQSHRLAGGGLRRPRREPRQHFLTLVRELVAGDRRAATSTRSRCTSRTLDSSSCSSSTRTGARSQRQRQGRRGARQEGNRAAAAAALCSQLRHGLQAGAGDDFLRDFVSSVWSQAVMKAATVRGADSPSVARCAGRARPADERAAQRLARAAQGVPDRAADLMKTLNAGMDMIGWPEAARKDFFGKLLPAHARVAQGRGDAHARLQPAAQAGRRACSATPMPKATECRRCRHQRVPVLDDVVQATASAEPRPSAIGLVDESRSTGTARSTSNSGPERREVSEVDIKIDGMPTPEPVEPTRGASLADHVQIGFAYQMHLDGEWHKVRLSHVSAGRTFFVFTRGSKHQRTISMTSACSRACARPTACAPSRTPTCSSAPRRVRASNWSRCASGTDRRHAAHAADVQRRSSRAS